MHFCCVYLSFFETDLMDFMCEKKKKSVFSIGFHSASDFCCSNAFKTEYIKCYSFAFSCSLNRYQNSKWLKVYQSHSECGHQMYNRRRRRIFLLFFYLYTYHFVRLPVNAIVSVDVVVVVKIDIVNCQFIHKFISWKTQNMLNGLLSFTPPHSFVS